MTPILAVVRAWLNDSPAGEVCDGRISTVFDPSDGVPAIHLGATSGGPLFNPSTNLDIVEVWQVALYVHGGRTNSGLGDLPDEEATWAAVTAIAEACRALNYEHYRHVSGAQVVSATVASFAPGTDPDTGEARATLTLTVGVWR